MNNLLLSAAIGDIAGMPYEFNATKNYDEVDLLLPYNNYTDDTLCTFACAEALLKNTDIAENLRYRCRADIIGALVVAFLGGCSLRNYSRHIIRLVMAAECVFRQQDLWQQAKKNV